MLAGEGVARVEEAIRLRWSRVRRVGPDLLVEAYPRAAEVGEAAMPGDGALEPRSEAGGV
jgi:hypothetical protein